MIQSVHGVKDWIGSPLPYAGSSLVWLAIFKTFVHLGGKIFDLLSFCKEKVVDGFNTSFWNDTWLGSEPLKVEYPRVYALELDKEVIAKGWLMVED